MEIKLQRGGKYRFKYKSEANLEPITYIGHNWSGNGYWHQFEKNGKIWCELRDSDLDLIEPVEEIKLTKENKMDKPNIDLTKIKVEELEEVTEGYWPCGEWMIVPIASLVKDIEDKFDVIKVYFISNKFSNKAFGEGVKDDLLHGYDTAYKLPPEPEKKLPTRDEAILYLKKLDLKCINGGNVLKVSLDGAEFDHNFLRYGYEELDQYKIAIFDRNGLIEDSEHTFYEMMEV